MRKEQIDETLTEVEDLYQRILEEYDKSHGDGSMKKLLRPKVASLLEHLRRVLDYCAKDIHEAIKASNSKGIPLNRVKFPHENKYGGFKKAIRQHIGDLINLRPDVFKLLEMVQPFRGDVSIKLVCELTNKTKHDSFDQERVDKKRKVVSGKKNTGKSGNYGMMGNIIISDAENVVIEGVEADNIIFEDTKNAEIRNLKVGDTVVRDSIKLDSDSEDDDISIADLIIERIDWASFQYVDNGKSHDVITIMKHGKSKVRELVDDLYKIL